MGKFLDSANTVVLDEKANCSSTEYDINDLYDKSLTTRGSEGSFPPANYDKSPPAIPAIHQNQAARNSSYDKNDINDKSLTTGLLEAFSHPTIYDKRVSDLIHWRDLTPEQLQNLWARVKQGEPIQIYSDTLGEAIWWVRDDEIASALRRQGIAEAIYTIAELRELAGKDPEFLRDIHQLKRQFGGTLKPAPAQPKTDATHPPPPDPDPSKTPVCCGDCQHFQRDVIGDGTGIGRCAVGVVARPQIDPPPYPKALRRCNQFHTKES